MEYFSLLIFFCLIQLFYFFVVQVLFYFSTHLVLSLFLLFFSFTLPSQEFHLCHHEGKLLRTFRKAVIKDFNVHNFHRLFGFKEELHGWRQEVYADLSCPAHSLQAEPHAAKRPTRSDDCEVNLCEKQCFFIWFG